MPTPQIRPYTAADRAPALACFYSNVPKFFTAQEEPWFVSALEEPDGPNFVVEVDDQVVGVGGYEVTPTTTPCWYSARFMPIGMAEAGARSC